MRLLKLAAYALFGYALYEFIRGMMNEAQAGAGSALGGGSGGGQSHFPGAGATQNISGPGEGQDVETQEPDGGMMRHRVGRGVVSR
jgi:hypothetical protein